MSVRVVCFDLGGVVVRICRSFDEAVLTAGVPLRALPKDPSFHRRRHELAELHQTGAMLAKEFHSELSAAVGGLYDEAEIARVHAAIIRGEYAGITETILAIGAAGLRTACLSNTNDAHWEALLRLPSLQALDARHASHLWGLSKPGEAIYRRFERELSAEGRSILFFDDLPENVETALSLGWDAVQIDHTGDTASQVRDALRSRGITLA